MKETYDETDLDILRLLKKNSRLSYRQISSKLKIHPNTVIARIKKLEREGVIEKYTIGLDYKKLGYGITAIFNLAASTRADAVAKEIVVLPHVREIHKVTGQYDLVATVVCRDIDDLNELFIKIASMPAIQRSGTQIVLESYKPVESF
ncbi:Lrp/AsnC family transcriptional regulator [Candidatus Micrarchaeota archaeon]|nr:Lrp/AsnC family transcriptional regulator [Candidatus Micrarchaeota archaeon]